MFFPGIYFEELSVQIRLLIERMVKFRPNLTVTFDDNNQERKSWICLGQYFSRSFCPNFPSSCWYLVAFVQFTCQKFVTNQPFGWEFCRMQQITFYTHQVYEKFNFHKKSPLYIFGRSVRDVKLTIYFHFAQKRTLHPKLDRIFIFFVNTPSHFTMLRKKKLKISSLLLVYTLNL